MPDTKPTEYLYGTFISEISNRFLCNVNIDGRDEICYVPSSCRLSNFIDMTGRTVILKPNAAPNSKTSYSLYAFRHRKSFILLNLAQANRVIESQIKRRFFSFLGARSKVSREHTVDGYKTDLFIHDTNTLIEIKTTLSFSQKAVFPSVYSERAIKQLKVISHLLDEGYRACYILVSLNPGVKEMVINSDMEDFYNVFKECADKGMMYCAFSVRLREHSPELYSKINVTI